MKTRSLEEIRAEIADIDRQIANLIAERTNKAKDVLEVKHSLGKGIEDEEQTQIILNRAVDLAVENSLDAGAVKKIFEILVQMNVQRQHDLSGEDNLP